MYVSSAIALLVLSVATVSSSGKTKRLFQERLNGNIFEAPLIALQAYSST